MLYLHVFASALSVFINIFNPRVTFEKMAVLINTTKQIIGQK